MGLGDFITFDTGDFMRGIGRLENNTVRAAKKGQKKAGNALLLASQEEVPHDKGTLANTGVVEEDGDETIVGYHTPYAARLHENPQYNFQKGRKGKYLEDPIKNNLKELNQIYGEEVKRNLN